jgi:hypothetical protein
MSLQLYNDLLTKVSAAPVDVNPTRLCATINRLPDDAMNSGPLSPFEVIYALIQHHYYQETASTRAKTTIPYGGKTFDDGNGVLYTLSNLPPSLVQIIAKYIEETVSTQA